MQVTFVRTVGEKDRIYVVRDDGSESSWSFASYGPRLPHDLVHLVVESITGLRPGLWGRVAAGADMRRINAAANRMGGKDKYKALGDDISDVLVSEALAIAPWSDESLDDVACLDAIAKNAADMGVALPDSIEENTVAAVRARLSELRREWRQLVPKGSIRLSFPDAAIQVSTT